MIQLCEKKRELVTQRNTEVKIIKGWIAEYKADLIALTKQIKAPAEPKS